jgi:hypothetical protein
MHFKYIQGTFHAKNTAEFHQGKLILRQLSERLLERVEIPVGCTFTLKSDKINRTFKP